MRLVGAVAEAMVERGLTLAIAEASTGGVIADTITDRPGASAYLRGAIIPYDNRSKSEILAVSDETLHHVGAVSKATAEALAEGARRAFDSDIGLAVTGLLGPQQRRSRKPIGLTYIAVAGPAGVRVVESMFAGSRRTIKLASAEAGLRLVLEEIAATTSAEAGRIAGA